MFKKIYRFIVIFSVFVIVNRVNADGSEFGRFQIGAGQGVSNPFQTTFTMSVFKWLDTPVKSATIDITLSNGIQLISGDLHWRITTKKDTVFRKEFFLKIGQPGIFEVSATFHAFKFQDTTLKIDSAYANQLRKVYLYVREDTIAFFRDREVMEQMIRDSLIYRSTVVEARRARNDSIAHPWRYYHFKVIPQSKRVRLMFYYAGRPDQKNSFTYNQEWLIGRYHLVANQPDFHFLDQSVNDSTWMTKNQIRTKEQSVAFCQLIKQQLNELYEFDKQILRENDDDAIQRLLIVRDSLFNKQVEDMDKLLDTKK